MNAQGSSGMTTTQWIFLSEYSYLLHCSNNKFISWNLILVFSNFFDTSYLNFGHSHKDPLSVDTALPGV